MSAVGNDPNVRPRALNVRHAFIPAELRERPQWVNWVWEWRDGKWTKPPRYVNGQVRSASSTDPTTWTSFEDAERHYRTRTDLAGVGFALSKADD